MAKFLINPAIEHYRALKRLAVYLRRQIKWGIIYWRPAQLSALAEVKIELDIPGAELPSVPWPSSYTDPGTYVDASLGNIPIKMASTSGYATTIAGSAIAWRSKTQPIMAQNVSEAELIAGNAAGKVVKYIRMVLKDLGFSPNGPSPIWEDDKLVLKIVNHDRPTPRSRHIAIRYFGLQQLVGCCELGELILIHIHGIINPSDALRGVPIDSCESPILAYLVPHKRGSEFLAALVLIDLHTYSPFAHLDSKFLTFCRH